jgi:lipopolysaccharide transport system ATP-binding protein
MKNVISVEALSKRYMLGTGTPSLRSLVRTVLGRVDPAKDEQELWALKDVSFSVGEGEIFGIVGRNGAGKSTLLKILSRVIRPTSGRVEVRGRVGALLEVGTGFHPDMTGRENIYFNGTLIGMEAAEIKAKFDEIVEFAGIGRFIDTPIKRYSSGMHARLGFAVAANLRPEILIVDEVLSVGDVLFRQKSMAQMEALTGSGISVLFVSHNLGSVGAICSRGMLLEGGRLKVVDQIGGVLNAYIASTLDDAEGAVRVFDDHTDLPAFFTRLALEREDGTPSTEFDLMEDIWLRVRYVVDRPLPGLQLAVLLQAGYEDLMQSFDTDDDAFLGIHQPGTFEKKLRLRGRVLKEGDYSLTLAVGIQTEMYDHRPYVLRFSVSARSVNAEFKSFRRERQGRLIWQGEWRDAE